MKLLHLFYYFISRYYYYELRVFVLSHYLFQKHVSVLPINLFKSWVHNFLFTTPNTLMTNVLDINICEVLAKKCIGFSFNSLSMYTFFLNKHYFVCWMCEILYFSFRQSNSLSSTCVFLQTVSFSFYKNPRKSAIV